MPNLPINNASVKEALVTFYDTWDNIELEDLKDQDTVPDKAMYAALKAVAPSLFSTWFTAELNKLADEYDTPRKDDFEEFASMRRLFARTLRKISMEYQEGTR
jgi:hypothetical protein